MQRPQMEELMAARQRACAQRVQKRARSKRREEVSGSERARCFAMLYDMKCCMRLEKA